MEKVIISMQKLLSFIDNRNILTEVPLIFKGKVEPYMLSHLTEKAEYYLDSYGNHLKAWVEFIGFLDGENSRIFFDYLLGR